MNCYPSLGKGRNIGPACAKQYGADVHLHIRSVVTFLDEDV